MTNTFEQFPNFTTVDLENGDEIKEITEAEYKELYPQTSPIPASTTTSSQNTSAEGDENSSSGHSSDNSVSSSHSAHSNDRRIKVRRTTNSHASSKPSRTKRKEFRINAKQFSLTYPKCPVPRDEFDKTFKEKFQPSEYKSAREQHKDGTFHMHLFVGFIKRTDVCNARYFDVSIAGITYHPNIQRTRSRNDWLAYIAKGSDHGELEQDIGFNPLLEKLGKRKSMYADFKWSEEYRTYLSLMEPNYPIKLHTPEKVYELFKPDPSFKKRSWWIVAPPNAGKTRWINKTFKGTRIYCPRMGKYPFEGYKDQDIIIYDDRSGVTFEEFADVLNTWDITHPVFGEVRFTTQNWKLGHTRSIIVLSNKTIEESLPDTDWNRMKKRFIQIINPTLLDPDEMSEAEEEQPEQASSEAAAFIN